MPLSLPLRPLLPAPPARLLRSSPPRRLRLLPSSRAVPDGAPDGEEKPESLFMRELRRRGMDAGGVASPEDRKEARRGVAIEDGLEGQRERSTALNSEGLEGLIPRARLLLSIGATFFLSFGPLILVTVASFSALYLYFGSTFIHDGKDMHVTPPPYVDPYELLKDDPIYRAHSDLE